MDPVSDKDNEFTVVLVYESFTEENGARMTISILDKTNVKWHSACLVSTLKHSFLFIPSPDSNIVLESDAATRRQYSVLSVKTSVKWRSI